MIKKLLTFFLCFFTLHLFAQEPEILKLESSATVEKSIFTTVEVADTRFDDVYMGFVQKGAFNRKAPVQLELPMTQAVKQFAENVVANASRQQGAILINIRDFFMYEAEKATSETGTFIFKAGCYYRVNDAYHFLFGIDTSITVKSVWDVTNGLKKTACNTLAAFIKQAAYADTTIMQQAAWTYADILDINSKEKAAIPVYNVSLPKRGLYKDFTTFKNNEPSDTGFIEVAGKREIPAFYTLAVDEKKGKPLNIKNCFAACDGNKLYFFTPSGTAEAIKKDNDFYFFGKGYDASNAAMVSTAYYMFGLLGGLVATASADQQLIEYRIDYSSGKFLPVRKL